MSSWSDFVNNNTKEVLVILGLFFLGLFIGLFFGVSVR